MSYARTAARTALAMIMSHHEDMEIWHVTKGMATEDEDGKKIDSAAIWQDATGYACRVADLAYYNEKFFDPVLVPPRPDGVASSESESDQDTDDDEGEHEVSSPKPSTPPAR